MKGSGLGCEELMWAAAAAGRVAGVGVVELGWLCLAEGKGDWALVPPNGCSSITCMFPEDIILAGFWL